MVEAAEKRFSSIVLPKGKSLTVAIMGCPVNGPGEAREADAGIACGNGSGVLFSRGEQLATLPEGELLDALYELVLREVEKM